MRLGETYMIELGDYEGKYIVTAVVTTGIARLQRMALPKSKVDGKRLPPNIKITYCGQSVGDFKSKEKGKNS